MLAQRHIARTLATVASVLAATSAGAELAPLEPYQMVRSLQLVQDRIADGDHAALPMQRKLIELIDERLRSSKREDYEDDRNFRALLVYAMSGGNPRTVESIVSRLPLEDTQARLGTGVLEYLRGRPGDAAKALENIDPREVPSEVAAFLALVKGSIVANDDPQKSLTFLDLARVMGPGTLVEEAALRRSITLSVSQTETDRFLLASEQYVRRFLRSPYASQFADAFVDGVVQLHGEIELRQIADIIAAMNDEQAKVIYLRLARKAAIDQHAELLAFARAGLETTPALQGSEKDPRAVLYSTVAAVTTDEVDVVRTRLESIDRSRLSAGDRMLLDAAMQIIDGVTSRPGEAEAPKMPSEQAMVAPATADPLATPVEASAVPEDGGFITDARKKLESIDKLLQETKE
jgi:chemotaxis protein MotC